MKIFLIITILVLVSVSYKLNGQVLQQKLNTAKEIFNKGEFNSANSLYLEVIDEDPCNTHALLHLSKIALLSNKPGSAEEILLKLIEISSDMREAGLLLAEAYYRQDKFQKAAQILRSLGRDSFAKKLESFHNKIPYELSNPEKTFRIKFISTDPLPLIELRVNNSESLYFLLDTGASEVIINSEISDKLKVKVFGEETGTFAGGKKALYVHGTVDSLSLDQLVIKNVPVHILNTTNFSAAGGGRKVDGIIGTVLLYHFLSTINYLQGELILEPKKSVIEETSMTSGNCPMPFWMSGDHIIVTWGRVNEHEPMLLFVDTGAAGFGFLCPESTIKHADIKLPKDTAEGIGGAGKVTFTPFYCDEVTLGELKQPQVLSAFGLFPAELEYGQGFRIGGLVSHSFFRPYSLTFDFSGMRIYIRNN